MLRIAPSACWRCAPSPQFRGTARAILAAMSTAFPIPCQTRQATLTASGGKNTFGPFDFLLYDASDVVVAVKPAAGDPFAPLDVETHTPIAGEFWGDTTKNELTVGDGATVGGIRQ